MANIPNITFYDPTLDGYDYSVKSDLGKEDFLHLLVTQLRYQDPLSPMQDQAFIAQLAQFSQLEQLENMTSSLETSTQVDYVMSQTIANTMATTLIGKTVVAEGADFYLALDGQANLSYHLDTEASSVTVKIYNESGALVRTIQQEEIPKGNNTYIWDGRDDNGNQASPGTYSYEVSASTLTGENVDVSKRVIGPVESVKYVDGRAYLIVGGYKVDLSTIIEILDGDSLNVNYNS